MKINDSTIMILLEIQFWTKVLVNYREYTISENNKIKVKNFKI